MKIDLDLALGKKTESAVINANGGLLLPEGFTLTELTISALRKQGITHIEISDENNAVTLSPTAEKKIRHIESLLNEFNTPKMTELKECLIDQIRN